MVGFTMGLCPKFENLFPRVKARGSLVNKEGRVTSNFFVNLNFMSYVR